MVGAFFVPSPTWLKARGRFSVDQEIVCLVEGFQLGRANIALGASKVPARRGKIILWLLSNAHGPREEPK